MTTPTLEAPMLNTAPTSGRRAPRAAAPLAALALLAFTAVTAPAARADETFGLAAPSRAKSTKPAATAPSTRLRVDVSGAPQVALEPLDNRELKLQDEIGDNQRKMLRIGVARDLDVTAASGSWSSLPDGSSLWVAEVVSPGAIGLRLHLADLALPPGAELALYGVEAAASGPGEGAPEVIRGSSAAAASHWSGTVAGERARIEYLAPAGAPTTLPFRLDQLQHIYRDPIVDMLQAKAAGPCHNDVTCFPEWSDVARSVALYSIVFSGGTGACTGQLINDQTQDFTPYFLTANHCVLNGAEAASTEFFWFYQTSSCGGAPPSIGSVPRSQGASLVSTNAQSDYSLLIVDGALPNDVFWSGWTSLKPGLGTPVAAIHHPSADFKRISFGFNDTPALCPANHVTISWTDGPTEPGSSGSGVFREDTQQLFGQLHGGPSACGNETFDCYGAFNTTYTRVKNFLKAGSDDSSEQNDSCSKPKLVKNGALNSRVVKVNDEDWYKITVPANKSLTVHLDFFNANGDIDLDFYGTSCDGPTEFVSRSSSDSEEISVTNVSGRSLVAWWRVYLYSDTRNSYNQVVSVH
jgi:V8-like Glu-specific endopeptidase